MPPYLASHRLEHADGLEADAAMQRDASVVGQRDSRKRAAIAFLRELVEELRVKRATDALPVTVRMHVSGNLRRPAIGGALAMQTAVRVAHASTVALGDEPLPSRDDLCDARGKFVDRRRRGFERDDRRLDERAIDRQKRWRVALGRLSYTQRLSHLVTSSAPAGMRRSD